MPTSTWLTLLAVLFVVSIGDVLVKLASSGDQIRWALVATGGLFYALTAIGWVYLLRDEKLATISVIYDVASTLLVISLGVFVFQEGITIREGLGLGCAGLALYLLSSGS